jgi:hypothetical protein
MKDGPIKNGLIGEAWRNPPVSYVIYRDDRVFDALETTFPLPPDKKDDQPIHRIIAQGRDNKPGGIIIFGYQDDRSMQPIIQFLDRIPEVDYHTIELKDGRKVYLMSHSAARKYLPQPKETRHSEPSAETKICFNQDIMDALSRLRSQHPRVNDAGKDGTLITR